MCSVCCPCWLTPAEQHARSHLVHALEPASLRSCPREQAWHGWRSPAVVLRTALAARRRKQRGGRRGGGGGHAADADGMLNPGESSAVLARYLEQLKLERSSHEDGQGTRAGGAAPVAVYMLSAARQG